MLTHRLALGTALATAVLIVFGGLVTNTGAALAVPDWPDTFGHNLFLYPWSGMVGGVFYEHGHRLLGATVGLLTLALAAALWRRGTTLRMLGLVAVLTVVAQGMLGGLRVVLQRDDIALIHGPLAQAFLALVVTLAYLTSPAARTPMRVRAGGGLRRSALVAVAVTYAQIVLGALVTHAGWLWLHVGGAVAVFAVVPVVTARARRTGDAVARPLARALLGLLGLQLALGIGAYLARFSPIWIPGEQATILALPVLHRLVGGLLLAATVVLAVRLTAAPARDGVTLQREPAGLGGSPRTPHVSQWASPVAANERPRETADEVGRGSTVRGRRL
jgi:cytochrome c oxidase assembly protein subunit 15